MLNVFGGKMADLDGNIGVMLVVTGPDDVGECSTASEACDLVAVVDVIVLDEDVGEIVMVVVAGVEMLKLLIRKHASVVDLKNQYFHAFERKQSNKEKGLSKGVRIHTSSYSSTSCNSFPVNMGF